VQLANFAKVAANSRWPELRDAQLKKLALRNTGMAVTIDIGDPNDIHPTNKQDVGKRLALAAQVVAYGQNVVGSGPLQRQVTREGDRLRVWFDSTGGGLTSRGEPRGFELAGADGTFRPASARIEGATIVVSAPEVKEPRAVRYAWSSSPEASLFNREGLPASPFQADVRSH
jgi:sialate O-acetylesterase